MACSRLFTAVAILFIAAAGGAHAQCNQTFMDALGGGSLWLLRQGIDLAGFSDKLPDPSIGVTILAPNNDAWLRFLFKNGFFLTDLSGIGDKLVGVITFHIIPSAVTPEALSNPEGGSVPTLYGLLTGQQADLKTTWYRPEDGPEQFLFQGGWDDTVTGTKEVRQVCNSWVYIVDKVLKPAYDLSDVQKVDIPDLGSIGAAPASPSPSPSPSPVPAPGPGAPGPVPAVPAVPLPPACDKTFAQAAGEVPGLTLLKTILSQAQYGAALPDPAYPYTLFAPTDSAFTSFLAAFNLSIPEALKLGDRLNSVLLYHVAPGTYPPELLATQSVLTTGLALKTNDASLTLGVSTADGNTTVSGKYPGNTAKLLSSLTVCASQVYVVDTLLIPTAASLDAIPATTGGLPPPAPTPAAAPSPAAPTTTPAAAAPSPAPAAAVPSPALAPPPVVAADGPAEAPATLDGVALATGYLAGCSVKLSGAEGGEQSGTTDVQGRFAFSCAGGCGAAEAVLTVPAAGQPTGCLDSLTGLPPPFDVVAYPSQVPDSASLAALSPLTTLTAAAVAQQAAAAAAPAAARKLLAGGAGRGVPARRLQQGAVASGMDASFGIAEAGGAAGTSYGDPLAAALAGDLAAYDLLSKSQDLVCTGSVGGALLAGLVGSASVTPAAAAQALFSELSKQLLAGSGFNLTSQAFLQSLLGSAQAALAAGAPGAAPPATDAAAATQAASETLALLNSLLQQAVTMAEETKLAEAGKMVQALARLAWVCQADVAPAAAQLAGGALSAEAWRQRYTLEGIKDAAINATLPA